MAGGEFRLGTASIYMAQGDSFRPCRKSRICVNTWTRFRRPQRRSPSTAAAFIVSARGKLGLVVHPLNACDIWCCRNTETTGHAMAPSATPHERMLVGVPVSGGALHGLLDLGPCL